MVKYTCEKCGKELSVDVKAKIPECCGKKMKQIPLDACTHPQNAESYRTQNADDACEDGVQ